MPDTPCTLVCHALHLWNPMPAHRCRSCRLVTTLLNVASTKNTGGRREPHVTPSSLKPHKGSSGSSSWKTTDAKHPEGRRSCIPEISLVIGVHVATKTQGCAGKPIPFRIPQRSNVRSCRSPPRVPRARARARSPSCNASPVRFLWFCLWSDESPALSLCSEYRT